MPTLALLLALAADAAAPAVEVAVTVLEPLRLDVRGQLHGRLEVVVRNHGPAPVALEHADVHGFRFEPEAGGPTELLLHPCDCAFVLGPDAPPESRRFRLGPGEARRLVFDDFACAGGPFHPPPPGPYRLRYRLGPPPSAPDGGSPPGERPDLVQCRRMLLEANQPQAIVSPPVVAQVRRGAKLRPGAPREP